HLHLVREHRLPGTRGAGDVRQVLRVGAGGAEEDHRELAEDDLLGEVLRADRERQAGEVHVADGSGDLARRDETTARAETAAGQAQTERAGAPEQQGSSGGVAEAHETPFGVSASSRTRPAQSTSRATTAMISAPRMRRGERKGVTPVTMSAARPPALMKVAKLAAPTTSTSAVRTPAMITGSASGSSTRRSTSAPDIPMPRAASTSVWSTCCS